MIDAARTCAGNTAILRKTRLTGTTPGAITYTVAGVGWRLPSWRPVRYLSPGAGAAARQGQTPSTTVVNQRRQ